MSRSSRRLLTLLGASLLALSQLGAATAVLATHDQPSSRSDHAIFFAADGMREEAVKRYANQGVMPTMRSRCRRLAFTVPKSNLFPSTQLKIDLVRRDLSVAGRR